MKIIDLLVKIANRKDMPLSFRYEGIIWVLKGGKYYQKLNDNIEFEIWFEGLLFKYLNDEIELIEENKKIEKLKKPDGYSAENYIEEMFNKINELIDEVNKLKE